MWNFDIIKNINSYLTCSPLHSPFLHQFGSIVIIFKRVYSLVGRLKCLYLSLDNNINIK